MTGALECVLTYIHTYRTCIPNLNLFSRQGFKVSTLHRNGATGAPPPSAVISR